MINFCLVLTVPQVYLGCLLRSRLPVCGHGLLEHMEGGLRCVIGTRKGSNVLPCTEVAACCAGLRLTMNASFSVVNL